MAQLTDLEKRLIAAMYYGVSIGAADGHRWLEFAESASLENSLDQEYFAKLKTPVSCKVYGPLGEALDRVDSMLVQIGRPSLLDTFSQYHLEHAYAIEPKDGKESAW